MQPGSVHYCSSDMTIEDMLLVCFSIAVPACSSIWFEVMFDDSVAKSTSVIRPVAALVLVLMFDRLLYTWLRRLVAPPMSERTALTLSSAVVSLVMAPAAPAAVFSSV